MQHFSDKNGIFGAEISQSTNERVKLVYFAQLFEVVSYVLTSDNAELHI